MFQFKKPITQTQNIKLLQQAMQQQLEMNAIMQNANANVSAQVTQQRMTPKVRQSQYIAIEVVNTTGVEQNILLWDSIGAYQLQNGYNLPAGVNISLTTKAGVGFNPYLLYLNRLVSGSTFYFNELDMEVTDQTQFNRVIQIYDDSQRVGNVTLYDSFFPSQYRNSMQRQLSMVEMPRDYRISRTTSWLYSQPANSTVTFRMTVTEEISSNG